MKFKVVGIDPDSNTTLTYTTDNLPTLATLDSATGQFTWTPTPGQLGDYHINFTVSDGELTASTQALIKVALAPSTPTVNLDLTPSFPATPGQQVIVQTQATGLADITNITATVDGKVVTIDNLGRFYFTPTTPGKVVVTATAIDADGRVGNSSTVIKVRDPLDHTAPVVQFAPGLDGDKLTSVTKIVGTVNDRNLDSWVLEEATFGKSNWSAIATGNQSTDGVLAQFDPTALNNGFYQLRLTATSIGGNTSSTQIEVEADSVTKVGDYHRSETDFSLNLSGANFNLVRSYDSLNQNTTGAFGYGWELNTASQIQTNVLPTGNEQFGIYNSLRVGTRLYLNLPTGERVGFTFTPQQHTINGLIYYTPAWVADSGVNYTLQSADAKLTKSGSGFYDLVTGDAYNPASGHFTGSEYTLTAADGTVYNLSTKSGITDEIASNGVHLYFSDSGITSSTGDTVQFVKDGSGRLTQITAPDGSVEVYGYDGQGNLVSARNLSSGESHRYGYAEDKQHLLSLVTGTPGTSGDAIAYSTTPQISPVIADLGSASTFSTNTTTGNLISGGTDRYTISLRDSELHSTASSQVLVEVSVDGAGLNVPVIDGLTPLATHVDAHSAYALYGISSEGLNLIEVSSTSPTAYSLHVSIAGDVNHDGVVDGTDAQLLAQAIANGSYNSVYDFNHDGVIDATDVQILGSNYGFTANRAPVVSPTTVLTHTDLSTIVGLDKLATDPEGDSIFYRVVNPVDGTVTLTPDGHSALFKPIAGYSGSAGFDIVADDGFSSSTPTHVTVNVSNAGLENLDFEGRNPKLSDGSSTDLVVYGDFADQSHVLLSPDYLQFGSDNTAVASVSSTGHVTGLTDGVSVLSASSHGISAVTALRVGDVPTATTQSQLNVAIAEQYGLDLYPHAVTLTTGVDRRLLVRLNGEDNSPQLQAAANGTRYFVSNPNVISVTPDGVITSLHNGVANVTVVYGGAEAVVPVQVESPHIGATTLGTDGGVVEGTDGSMVMLGQGALSHDATVSINQINQDQLTLPIPDKFSFAGAFKLDVGDGTLNLPAQIAIPAPVDLTPGTQVFLLRQGELPDSTGTENPIWFAQESAMVGTDGMIRTQSPPWPGVTQSGTYTIAVPKFSYSITQNPLATWYTDRADFNLRYVAPALIVGGLALAVVAPPLALDLTLSGGANLALNGFIANYLASLAEEASQPKSEVEIVAIPKVGHLPYTTTAQVELNPNGIPTASVNLDPLTPTDADPFAPPVLQSAELNFNNNEPIVYLTGSNFLTNTDDLGSHFQDLTVEFHSGNHLYTGTIVPELSQNLGNNLYKLAVKVPQTVVLGESYIDLIRHQNQHTGFNSPDIVVDYKSQKQLELTPQNTDLALVANVANDTVSVINAANPQSILATPNLTSRDLLLANIPVGTPDVKDGPRNIAVTHNGTRAYVTLEQSHRVAVIDMMTLQQVDTNPQTPEIDPITLPASADPREIVISPDDEFAYIADRQIGTIYVLDINPDSKTYNQLVQTINLGNNGLRQVAINSDGTKLFVTTPSSSTPGVGEIFVVNIDPLDRPVGLAPNLRKWNQVIGEISADAGTEGIAATPDPMKMVFTNRANDAKGFGLLTITNQDPLHFAATTNYTKLVLGNVNDYFDVNEAMSAVVSSDGKYAFVAGRNGRLLGSGIPSIDGPDAGSNVGIIQDPLTDHAKLVAATRPIPMGLTTSLVLSGDNKVLYASYPGVASVFGFDVEQIIQTIQNPGDGPANDLTAVPIDDINASIDLAADLKRSGDTFSVPDGSNRAPIGLGGNPYGMAGTYTQNWLHLIQPNTTSNNLNTTFNWKFDPGNDVTEVNLFVSTFDQGHGLLPWDSSVALPDTQSSAFKELSLQQQQKLLGTPWTESKHHNLIDLNPNRILTVTWKRNSTGIGGTWFNADGTPISDPNDTSTSFALNTPLTANQQTYFAVEAFNQEGQRDFETSEFTPTAPISNDPFSSVTVLTHGFTLLPEEKGVNDIFYQMANGIASSNGGLILRYDKPTGMWDPVDQNGLERTDLTDNLHPGDSGFLAAVANNIEHNYQRKALVLLPEWSLDKESVIPDVGFTEGAADAIYASIVQLDQALGGDVGEHDASGNLIRLYNDNGDIIRTQGELFNSPLHFIGYSRGAVVNSEIIQRLGTFFPGAGGVVPTDNKPAVRSLQMTTIDPHDFEQPSLKLGSASFDDFSEPKIQVWDNVTFADNYYQTVADPNGSTFTPNGRTLTKPPQLEFNKNPLPAGLVYQVNGQQVNPQLDSELRLGTRSGELGHDQSLIGFTSDDGRAGPHLLALDWYAGTINRQLVGDDNFDKVGNWYKQEGVGQGWANSVQNLGLESHKQLELGGQRIPVSFDNTLDASMRGDYAVPTLFNGNFDQVIPKTQAESNARNLISNAIPGWSFHGGGTTIESPTDHLVKWDDITTLNDRYSRLMKDPNTKGNKIRAEHPSYLETVGYDSSKPNYALELKGGDDIIHNRFVVPDWGNLRFDLHVPDPAAFDDKNSYITIDLITQDGETELHGLSDNLPNFVINKPKAPENNNLDNPAVDLREVSGLVNNALIMQSQANRIGFGEYGFETFEVNIPKELRGKVASLKISVHADSSTTVYLDNIFFKNEALQFGSPYIQQNEQNQNNNDQPPQSQQARQDEQNQQSNYLIETPEYTVSYNNNLKTANWVSYQLNRSWMDSANGIDRPAFTEDNTLPSNFTKVNEKDISGSSDYQRGHIVDAFQRLRSFEARNGNADGSIKDINKDYYQTFTMTNVFPEWNLTKSNPGDTDPWTTLAQFLSNTLVGKFDDSASDLAINNMVFTGKNKELYVIAGRDGSTTAPGVNVSIPTYLWRVVLVLEPGQGIADVTKDTMAFAVYIPNDASRANKDWKDPKDGLLKSVKELEEITHYNFFSNIPQEIQDAIKDRPVSDIVNWLNALSAPLMAEDNTNQLIDINRTLDDRSIGHNSIPEKNAGHILMNDKILGTVKTGISQDSTIQTGTAQISISQDSFSQISSFQNATTEIGTTQIGPPEASTSEIGTTQVRSINPSTGKVSSYQTGTTQISVPPSSVYQITPYQINSSEVSSYQNSIPIINLNEGKISLPSTVTSEQFFSSNLLSRTDHLHTLTPESITTINNTAQTLWNTLLAPQTPFNINLQLTDSLAKGQLAEAIVTKYDAQGRPIGGTIEVDPTANGLGWFIDPNITDSNEFSQTLSDTASRATTNSDAYGHYDLLTALLHEMAHLAGFIWGNSGFDSHVQIVNSSRLFVGDNFSAPLTNDGSHLDPKTYAYDLLNPTLTPGLRELPSQIDVEILKEVRSADHAGENTSTQAALDSAPLTDILNGKFDITDTTDPNYGWTIRGAATILSKEAVLTEDSPLNSEFKLSFTVPQGAKYLEFTLKDATLGNDSADSPGDAFEVALLDANEKTSLVDTANGLTRTDALLNIQHDGTAYLSNQVILPATVSPNSTLSLHSPMTFKVDVSNIQAGTTATLYLDLLGFGNRDAKITIDDVELLNSDPVPPVANNDTATTDAGKQVTINVLANDTTNQTIDPTSIALATNPTNGNIAVNLDGTLAYTPNNNFVGTDTFTYTVANSDGTTSSPATVTVTVNDVAPQITDLPVPKKVYQLDPTNFTATATTTGDNHLTYIWDFGDGTYPQQGNTVQHTFTTSGEYQTTLTVVDAYGLKDTISATVYVGSTAPTQGDDPTLPPGFGNVAPQITDLPVPKKVYELDPTNFSATATSPLGEPLTYTWNFGDGTDAVVGQSVSHTFVASGQYDATLTVTDDFGFSDTKTVTVYVGSTAPTNDDSSLPDWNSTWDDIFRQFGNMS